MVLALKDTADFPIPTKNIVDNDVNFNYATSGSINAYDRTYLDIINANRTFFFPPANVLVERSTDSGSTWTTVDTSTYTTQQRGNLMCGVGSSLNIGTGNASTSQMLRVTLLYPGTTWYCSLDRAYIRWSVSGHSNTVKIQASTYGAQSTYTDITGDTAISGWPGDNMIKFSYRTAWGTNNSAHLYNIRFIFKYSSVNSSYISQQSQVIKIALFGTNFWGTTGTPRYAGHLYNWDYLQNVTFPAKVTSTDFTAPRFTATGSTYPHIAGNGLVTASATGGWVAGAGAIVLEPTSLRPSGSENGNISLGAAGQAWKNIYLTGSIYKGSYTYTLPSATGTLALTSDIPTVNDATLTIQKNGTAVQTFTANQSTNATANITVPESFSDLTGTVSTSQIANSAVTDVKIDWSTMCTTTDYSGTNSGNSWNMKEYKYADGTLELWGLISFGSLTAHTIDTCTITYPTAFVEAPMVVTGLVTGSGAWTLGNFSAAYIPNMDTTYAAFRCYNGSSENRDGAASFNIRGRWK